MRRFERSLVAHHRLHRDGAITAAPQLQTHPLQATCRRLTQGGRPGPAVQQGSGDALVILDRKAAEGLEQRWNRGVVADLHGNQELAVLDPLVGEGCHLGADPWAQQRLGRKHDQAGIGLLQPLVHLGDDVVAGADLPDVQPGVDSLLAEVAGQRFYGRFIPGGMAQKDPHAGALDRCRRPQRNRAGSDGWRVAALARQANRHWLGLIAVEQGPLAIERGLAAWTWASALSDHPIKKPRGFRGCSR